MKKRPYKMPDKSNSQLLDSIYIDLRKWRTGQETPSGVLRAYVAMLCPALIIIFGQKYVNNLAYLLIITVVTAFVSWVISGCVLRNKLESWPELIDRKLARYHPCDLAAWDAFQQLVREKGEIDISDLEVWVEREKRLTDTPEKKRRVLFLENTSGGKPKD